MTTPTKISGQDIYTGFFASVVLALLASNTLANFAVGISDSWLNLSETADWRSNIAAGFFAGVVVADPVGTMINRKSWRASLLRLIIGFFAGIFIQTAIVMPLAGSEMSRFVFLILAVLLVPFLMMANSMQEHLDDRGVTFGEYFAGHAMRLMGCSDRVLIVLTMALSFAGFWFYATELSYAMVGVGVILTGTTLYVANVHPEEDIENPWFYPSEEVEEEPIVQRAWARFKELATTVLPGAVLLGGIMRMAVEFLLNTYPNIADSMVDASATARTLGVVAASGLGVILCGMMLALGLGLVTLTMIGRIKEWNQFKMRESCMRLIKVMCFRPINR